MPSRSNKQARFMAGVAHDPKFAAKAGVPMSVGKKFNAADQQSGKLSSAQRRYRGGGKRGNG